MGCGKNALRCTDMFRYIFFVVDNRLRGPTVVGLKKRERGREGERGWLE